MSLLKRSISWSFLDNILQQLANFVIGIVLARILGPESFGIIAVVGVFIALINVFANGGFNEAIINNRNRTSTDLNTMFWFNNIFSFFLFALILCFSNLFFDKYLDYNVSKYINIAALSIVLMSLSSIHRVLFTIDLNFKVIAIVSFVSVILSGAISIFLALNNYGVYSLVYRMILGQLFTTLLFWYYSKWRPKFIFSLSSFKQNFSYAVYIFLPKFFTAIINNFSILILGKFFTPIYLGLYSRADSFTKLFSNNITNVVQRVSFSYLSNRNDYSENKIVFNLFVQIVVLFSFSACYLMFFFGKNMINILLGQDWIETYSMLKIMCLTIPFITITALNVNQLAVYKENKKYLFIEIISKFLTVISYLSIICYDIFKVLWIVFFISVFNYLISILSIKKFIDVKYQLNQVFWYVIVFGFVVVFKYFFIAESIFYDVFNLVFFIGLFLFVIYKIRDLFIQLKAY